MREEFADNNAGNLLEPDILVSQEYLKTKLRTLPGEPEQALLLAVLKDALETFQRLLTAKTKAGRRLFREAEEWIWSDESDRVFSFVHICEMLSLDPGYLRRGLHSWAANRQQEAYAPVADRLSEVTDRAPAAVRSARSLSADQRGNASPGESRRRAARKDSMTRFRRRRTASDSQRSKRA